MNDIPNESNHQTDGSSAASSDGKFKPLRIWPAGLLIVGMVVMVAAQFLPVLVEDGSMMLMMVTMMAPTVLGLLIVIWWLTFSRATVSERIVGHVGTLLVAGLAVGLSDKSMLGPAIIVFTVPMGTAAFAVGAILCRRHLSFKRTLVAILLAACGFGFTALLRSDGVWGHGALDWHWRWESSAEENMLAQRTSLPAESLSDISASELDAWLAKPEWPRFRGRDGLSQQHGPQIAVDWTTGGPEQLWRIAVGPGWSSFAVAGNLLFTQEQHGPNESIVCYAADSGKEIWKQHVESRFEDPLGGPGPRATPTLAKGGLFAQGANGQLLRLDPKSGDVVWMKDLREVAQRLPPTWGFSSSPLVVGSVVIVHAGGSGDKGTLAFDLETGDLKWSAAAGDHSYCSPQLCTIDDNDYVLMLTNAGINVLDPESGQQLLDYEWEYSGYRALQPQVVDGDSILLPTGPGAGTRRIRITKSDTGLVAEELWTSRQLRPDFNDFVVYENHAYGFDGAIFTCLDLATGQRKWKGGRYGKGQVLLLADSGILLVASEKGDVVLLKADPSGHQELTKFRAVEGRTWNHPVVIGDRLYIRNAQEAACYRLPLANHATKTAFRSTEAPDMTEPQFSFVETNGIKIRIAAMGEGPLVLLLHGFPSSWYTWRHQLPALAKAGYRAVAPDLRGYGESDKPPNIEDYDINQLTADAVGILDALGEKDAILVGHDWGALVGWAAMLQYPERFRAFVAMSAPYGGRMQEPFLTSLKKAYGDDFYYVLYFQEEGIAEAELDKDPRGFLSRVYTSPDTPSEEPTLTDPKKSAGGLIPRLAAPKELPDWLKAEDLDYYVDQFTKSGFRGGINFYRNFDTFFEVSQQLKEEKVSQPVLFIAGEKDSNIGGASAEQLSALLSGGTKDLRGVKLFPNAGHWVQQEFAEETNAAMIEFIEGLD